MYKRQEAISILIAIIVTLIAIILLTCCNSQHDKVGLILNKHEEPVKNHIYHWIKLSHYTDTFSIDISEDEYNTYQIGEVYPHGVCYIP